jgi:hypothetical protein
MLDANAVAPLGLRVAGRSYWSWTDQEWAGLLGQDQRGFDNASPAWAATPCDHNIDAQLALTIRPVPCGQGGGAVRAVWPG